MRSLVECLNISYINEMSSKLGDFRNKISDKANQILENWCLVKLSDMYPNKSFAINRNHWATELKSQMMVIVNATLKSGRKDKVVKSVWIDELDLDDNVQISERIRDKFDEEGLSKYVNKISYECANSAEEICSILSGTMADLRTYIQGELG